MKSAVPALDRLVDRVGVPDAELLRRFAADQNADAFAALVKRHGPMVLGLCRRVTRDAHAGEDAFQAVFLTLSRKAAAIRRPESLAAWLFGVARRIALKARADRDRRQSPPPSDAVGVETDPLERLSVREMLDVLDDELGRLPLSYRSALILCTMEGKSIEETARQLGASVGAVRGWLQRGRERLRQRFARRGLALPAVLSVSVVLSRECVAAPLVEAAVRIGTSAGAAPPAIAALAKGGMSITVKLAGIALLAASVAGVGLALMPINAAPPEQPVQPAKLSAEADPVVVEKKEVPRVDRFGDPLPDGALARLGSMRLRHGAGVQRTIFSTDGRFLVSGGGDGVVYIWDATTGRPRLRIENTDAFLGLKDKSFDFRHSAQAAALSPDNSRLAIAWLNAPPALYDAKTGIKLREIGSEENRTSEVQFSLDGKYAAASQGKDHRPAVVIESDTGKVVFSAPGQILFVPGGFIHCDLKDPNLTLHRLGDLSQTLQFAGHEGKVTKAWVSADGKRLFSLGSDRTVRIWDIATGKELRRFEGVPETVYRLAPSADGKAVLTLAGDAMQFLDAEAGKVRWSMQSDTKRKGFINALFLPGSETVVTGDASGRLVLWDAVTGKEHTAVRAHYYQVRNLIVSPDGKTLATTENTMENTSIYLWDAATLSAKTPERGHDKGITTAAFSPDGRLVATSGWNCEVRLWETRTGKNIRIIEMPSMAAAMQFTLDGRQLVTSDWDEGKLRFWDIASGKETRALDTGAKRAFRVALSPDGKKLFTTESGKRPTCRDFDTLKELAPFDDDKPDQSGILRLALSRDGTMLATAHFDGSLRVWDTRSFKKRYQLQAGAEQIGAIAFSPDSRLLAWCDGANGIRLTNVASGREERHLPGRVDSLNELIFAQDGKTLWYGSTQNIKTIFVWEVRSGLLREKLRGHDGPACPLAFSPDGSLLVTAGSDGSALVWDVRRRQAGDRAVESPLPEKLAACWDGLADTDAAKAFACMEVFRRSPAQGVPAIAGHVKPIPQIAPKILADLLLGLDSDTFKVRDAAMRELKRLGESAFADLRVAAVKSASAETRSQAERLLEQIEEGRLQHERALEVLETIGDDAAIRLLKSLASGHPEAPLTRDAKAALRRLE